MTISLFPPISFSKKLFLEVLMLFLFFAGCTMFYQYNREKAYKVDLLQTRLQSYNQQLYDVISAEGTIDLKKVAPFLRTHPIPDLRITLINSNGAVLLDNRKGSREMENHQDRTEVKQALQKGTGYDIERVSETLNKAYFYATTYFKEQHLIVRTSLPYDDSLALLLQADLHYLAFTLLLTLILTYIYYRFTQRIGKTITQLKPFARNAEENVDQPDIHFPNNELGEISQHIVRLYLQLKRSQEDKTRLKRELTQNIAHELKTPVSSIQGFLETLVKNPNISEPMRKQFMERCYAQSCRLSNLLHDISALTKMDDAAQSFTFEDIPLASLLQGIKQDTLLQLEDKHMTIEYNLPEEAVLHGNYGLVYSIFRNLTDNAIAYAGEGCTIRITCTELRNHFFAFSFADNGVGIPEQYFPRLFERFYRVDKGRSRKMGGTGLGLAIVKNAVILHGGQITLQTASSGGLDFRFTLPGIHAAN